VRYLVDANVLSEPTKPFPNAGVVAWLTRYERDIAVDPIILGEIRFGILCLPWESENGLRWATLLATLRAAGQAMPIKGSLIAATALVHDLIVVTRNRTDFEKAGIEIIDPFTA